MFPRQRVAVFIDGCFWHHCPAHATQPATNADWCPHRNERDRRTVRLLLRPFEFYNHGHLTNPNMIVMGSVGYGKSATVKALIRRLKAIYNDGRYLAVIDPKGEYTAGAADLGLTVIKLRGGTDRINPMDPGGGNLDTSTLAR